MATTGIDFKKIWERKIDKSYTAFYNSTKQNALFKNALINAIELKYLSLDSQKIYDEIGNVIKTGQVFNPSSNVIFLSTVGSPNISDYNHLLTVKCKYISPLNLILEKISYAAPIVITVNKLNNLRDGELINISSVTGNTNANGDRYIKRITNKTFALYSDNKLTVPIIGNGNYVSGGILSRVYYKYAIPYKSDRKISVFGEPTEDNPRFEVVSGKLKLYPTDSTCSEITIDYITKPNVFIDVTNSVTDLELTYPLKFLYYVADVAAKMFAEEIKDTEMINAAVLENNTNQ